jgi:hypothetical protein
MSKTTNPWNVLRLGFWAATVAIGAVGPQIARAEQAAGATTSRPAIHGILFNEDDSNPFLYVPAGAMKPEHLDRIVDKLADSQVTIMLINCNDKNAIYDSKVWDVYGRDFDPAKKDPPYVPGEFPRQWAHNLHTLLKAGVCPIQRMIDRCRQRGISPWVSIRMNDAHSADVPKDPLHSRFWMDHPEYRIAPFCHLNVGLNYALKPVRDHYMALLREVCDRFDMDGLELDWVRFPWHFRAGEEAEQSKMLTEWVAEVRQLVRAAEKKWKHPICLAARVGSRPEVAAGIGTDAVTWAKRGLIDHLIVAPFFATADLDIPVERWNELLKGTGVGVTVGLEQNLRSYWNEVIPNTPELRRGAAMAALARGSQGIYLFNYFEVADDQPYLLKEMGSVDSLVGKDRSYTITYVDIRTGEPNKPRALVSGALPKKLAAGESAEFALFIGPKPLATVRGEVKLKLAPEKAGEKCVAQVALNGQSPAAGAGYAFRSDALREGYNAIKVVNAGISPMAIQTVELSLRFPPGEK